MASRQTYGAPRIHAELSAQGVACCRNTVAKLMRHEQIVPRAIRHFRVTTDSRNTKEVSPNLVKRRFKAKRPNSCWLSDVTYIPRWCSSSCAKAWSRSESYAAFLS
jgi:transposase InsO family protein